MELGISLFEFFVALLLFGQTGSQTRAVAGVFGNFDFGVVIVALKGGVLGFEFVVVGLQTFILLFAHAAAHSKNNEGCSGIRKEFSHSLLFYEVVIVLFRNAFHGANVHILRRLDGFL